MTFWSMKTISRTNRSPQFGKMTPKKYQKHWNNAGSLQIAGKELQKEHQQSSKLNRRTHCAKT